ncbi:MAG: hypothetical protein NZL89_06640, partial [Leptospiraceae bacterium]|nr:hypothetical protein [Leptospiraceae bacterium]
MTGYGESRFTLGGVQVVCSARSVNSRFLEVAVYCPEELAWFKPHCEEIVRSRFTRGQIEIAFIPAAPLPSELVFNNDILTQYEKFLAQKLGKKKVVVPPQDYLHIPGFVEKKARDWRSYRSKLDFHLLRALIKMQHARRAEGKRTVRICLTHLRYLNRLLRRIAVLSAQAQKKRVLALRHRIYRDLLGYSRSEAEFTAESVSAAERRLIVQAAQAIWQQRREELVRLVSYDASEEIS